MKLTHADVRQILSIIEESAFDTIEIRMGDLAISASKSGGVRSALQPGAAGVQPLAPEASTATPPAASP